MTWEGSFSEDKLPQRGGTGTNAVLLSELPGALVGRVRHFPAQFPPF